MPRLDNKTKCRIIELKFPVNGESSLSTPQIIQKLFKEIDEGARYVIPSDRAIQKFIAKIKERRTKSMEFDEQPWTSLRHQAARIPDDPIVFELLKIWYQQQYQQQKEAALELPPKPFPIGVARWAVRLHRMAPGLRKERLLKLADQYFTLERMAELMDETVDNAVYYLAMQIDFELLPHDVIDQRLESSRDLWFYTCVSALTDIQSGKKLREVINDISSMEEKHGQKTNKTEGD